MFSPNGQIRTGNSRVRTQNENHRMRLRNEIDRQLGLGAHRIQSRGVQNHQALLEQGMGNINDGVAPHGYFDQALGIRNRIFVRQLIVPEP